MERETSILEWPLGSAPRSAFDGRAAPRICEYIDRTRWAPKVEGNTSEFYTGTQPIITFPALANVSERHRLYQPQNRSRRRDSPCALLVKCPGGFYPSLPFRLVCGYLGAGPGKITIKPGKYIRLKDARVAPATPRATCSSRSTAAVR